MVNCLVALLFSLVNLLSSNNTLHSCRRTSSGQQLPPSPNNAIIKQHFCKWIINNNNNNDDYHQLEIAHLLHLLMENLSASDLQKPLNWSLLSTNNDSMMHEYLEKNYKNEFVTYLVVSLTLPLPSLTMVRHVDNLFSNACKMKPNQLSASGSSMKPGH